MHTTTTTNGAGPVPLHELKISSRPPRTWYQILNAVLFGCIFDLGCLMINGFQFVFLLPLRLLPFAWAQELYREGIRYTKGAFGCLLVLMSQWFAPTQIHITFEREGQGCLTAEQIENTLVREGDTVVGLRLPTQSITIANHQVYTDWWYTWSFAYLMGTHKDVFIVLKKSLKWVPVVGWGMQFFDFIFLARSWAEDRVQLASKLSVIGRRAEQEGQPLSLIVYPEGTLVSEQTRPISKKHAEKMGIPNTVHTLLPRSTGLHFCLRSLSPKIPTLKLIDITVVYPGIPPMGYGQSYYTLRSTFFDRVPPPVIHMHIRVFDVTKDVPIGDLSTANARFHPSHKAAVEVDSPEAEKVKFDQWLVELWRDKDRAITRFHESGSLAASPDSTKARVVIPLQLRRKREILDAFCFFLPATVGYLYSAIRRQL